MKIIRMWSFFWSVFSCIRNEYRKIRTRKNFVFGHFSRSVILYNLAQYTNISKKALVRKAPLKERYVIYDEAKFINKNLQEAIMNRVRLLNRYRKEKTEATRSAHKRQIDFCSKLL